MNAPRLSTENVHATTVAKAGRAVMITGASGAGKSDLGLRLIDNGFTLVSDDRTILKRQGETLLAAAPATIAGKIEVRGIGILDVEHVDDVPVAMIVELASELQRMPDEDRTRIFLGVRLPLIGVDAMTPSAAAKVAIALGCLGRN